MIVHVEPTPIIMPGVVADVPVGAAGAPCKLVLVRESFKAPALKATPLPTVASPITPALS